MDSYFILLFFSVLEVPVYVLASAAAFLAAKRLKNGVFSSGMRFISSGMFVAALGNVYFFLQGLPGADIFVQLWGVGGDAVILFAYPVVSAFLLMIGFYKFIKVPRVFATTSPGEELKMKEHLKSMPTGMR